MSGVDNHSFLSGVRATLGSFGPSAAIGEIFRNSRKKTQAKEMSAPSLDEQMRIAEKKQAKGASLFAFSFAATLPGASVAIPGMIYSLGKIVTSQQQQNQNVKKQKDFEMVKNYDPETYNWGDLKDIKDIEKMVGKLEKIAKNYNPDNFKNNTEAEALKNNLQKMIDDFQDKNREFRNNFKQDSEEWKQLRSFNQNLGCIMTPVAKKDIIKDLTNAVDVLNRTENDISTLFDAFEDGTGHFYTEEKACISKRYILQGLEEMKNAIEQNRQTLQQNEKNATPAPTHKQNIKIMAGDLAKLSCKKLDPSGKEFAAFKKDGTLPQDEQLAEAFQRWKKLTDAQGGPGQPADWKCIGEQLSYFANIARERKWDQNSGSEASSPTPVTLKSPEELHQGIMKNYRTNDLGQLVSRQTGKVIWQNEAQLMKVVKVFHKTIQLQKLNPQEGVELKFSENALAKYGLKNFKILGAISNEGELELVDTSKAKELGKGTYGVAMKVLNLSAGSIAVVKFARSDKLDVAAKDVKNENLVLQRIHASGVKRGLQKPPRAFFDISEGEKSEDHKVGYLGVKYDGDLGGFKSKLNLENDKSKQAFSGGFDDLIHGLNELHKLGFVHGDIKPPNIFIKENKNGTAQFDIADMGGVRQADKITNFDPGITTIANCPISDLAAMKRCQEEENDQEFRLILQARDTYQIGTSIFNAITGDSPYEKLGDKSPDKMKNYTEEEQEIIAQTKDSQRFPDHKNSSFNRAALEAKGCSEDAINLLERMCHPNPLQRITATDAQQRIETPGFSWFA